MSKDTTNTTSGAADLPEALHRSTAADGRTELFNLPGYPLMVRAVDFNRIHTESEMRRTALLDEMQKAALAQRFDAADMATAAAQGFRDGVAKDQQAMWRHIETAPKGGQAILVTDGMDCYCVEWDEEFDWWTVDDNKLGPFRLRGSAPTHWMPLPAAPAR